MKVNRIKNYEVAGVVINMQNTTILNFWAIKLTGLYTKVFYLCENYFNKGNCVNVLLI